MNFEIHLPSNIIIGKNTRFQIGKLIRSYGFEKALIVSDPIMKDLGFLGEIKENLRASMIETTEFVDVQPDPSMESVDSAVRLFKSSHSQCIIALGGGSAIDTAKALSVMATNSGTMRDYMGLYKVKKTGAPVFAVPTTAGTGSDVTRVVVITDTENDIKMMCLDNKFLPVASIVDYELSMSMPKGLTAAVGVDALTHSIEAYVSKKANPVTDSFALLAIKDIYENILKAFEQPENEYAREKMMAASTIAGAAFSNSSVCTVHGMSRPIGAHFHIPHGMSNAMLLPVVTKYSISGDYKKYAEIARVIGIYEEDSIKASNCLYSRLLELNKQLRIPNLEEYGVDKAKYESLLDSMAQAAIDSGSPSNNPKQMSKKEIIHIYREAYSL